MNAQNIGLWGSAKAHGGVEVNDTVDESAALTWLLRKLANGNSHKAIPHIGIGGQFEGVNEAFATATGLRARVCASTSSATGTGECRKEQVEGEEETS